MFKAILRKRHSLTGFDLRFCPWILLYLQTLNRWIWVLLSVPMHLLKTNECKEAFFWIIVVSDLCCDTWRRMSWIEGAARGQRLKLLRNKLKFTLGWAGPWLILFKSVLRIRIHRIHMFLGLQDPDPDPHLKMSWIRNTGSNIVPNMCMHRGVRPKVSLRRQDLR